MNWDDFLYKQEEDTRADRHNVMHGYLLHIHASITHSRAEVTHTHANLRALPATHNGRHMFTDWVLDTDTML